MGHAGSLSYRNQQSTDYFLSDEGGQDRLWDPICIRLSLQMGHWL